MKKQIFIHAGPPKTGTSALQKWLNENINLLASFGVFYPRHNSDSNGISSGNLFAIYSKDESNTCIFDNSKTQALIAEFHKSEFSILFLSSEFFFKRMHEIKQHIPEAIFICYIRDPMEKRESLYNQGVKRHSFTDPFPKKFGEKPVPDITLMQEFISKYSSPELIIRLYGEYYFKDSSIVSDILFILGIDYKANLPYINSSYTLEALEFKRWVNNYNISEFNSDIDIALQKITTGTNNYSLVSPDIYIKQRNSDYIGLSDFFKQNTIENSAQFLNDLANKRQKEHRQQKISPSDFELICQYLKTELPDKGLKLRKKIIMNQQIGSDTYRDIFLATFKEKINIIDKVRHFLCFKKTQNLGENRLSSLKKLRKNLNIEESTDDAEILKEIALFAESHGHIEFSLKIMKQAKKERPDGPLINKKIRDYQNKLPITPKE